MQQVHCHLTENLGLRQVDDLEAESAKGNIMRTPFVRTDSWNSRSRMIATYRVYVRDFSKTAYSRMPEFRGLAAPDLSKKLRAELVSLTKDSRMRVLMRRVGKDGREYEITHPLEPGQSAPKAAKQTK